MANYVAMCRSNYFRVKDAEAFIKWAKGLNLEVGTQVADGDEMYGLFPEEGWPDTRWIGDSMDTEDIDFEAELSEHLVEKEVAVLIEIGYEKMRYLCGIATAVAWNGGVEQVSLGDIYGRIKERWCVEATDASY